MHSLHKQSLTTTTPGLSFLIDCLRLQGDDGVCMKTRPRGTEQVPTTDVLVRNMNMSSCSCPTRGSDGVAALKLGTDLVGGVSNVVFENSYVGRAGYALKLDSPFVRHNHSAPQLDFPETS